MRIPFSFNKKIGIYKMLNLVNNKCYIGSSINIYNRVHKHRTLLIRNKHENAYLQNAVNKYSIDNFDIILIEECLKEELLKKEQHYIDLLLPEYNITAKVTDNTPSKESRIKISNTLKAKHANNELAINCSKKIDRYTLDGQYIDSFNSLMEAERTLGIASKNIRRVLNGKHIKAGGFQWKESKDSSTLNDISKKKKTGIMVKLIDVTTNEKLVFNSINAAEDHLNVYRTTLRAYVYTEKIYKKRYKILPL